jgi:hypothetical protein
VRSPGDAAVGSPGGGSASAGAQLGDAAAVLLRSSGGEAWQLVLRGDVGGRGVSGSRPTATAPIGLDLGLIWA